MVTVVFLQAILLGGIGLALGWRPSAGGLLAYGAVIALGTAAFVAMGLLLGGTLRAEIVLAAANLLWFVFAGFGALTLETETVPSGLAQVASSPRRVHSPRPLSRERSAIRPRSRWTGSVLVSWPSGARWCRHWRHCAGSGSPGGPHLRSCGDTAPDLPCPADRPAAQPPHSRNSSLPRSSSASADLGHRRYRPGDRLHWVPDPATVFSRQPHPGAARRGAGTAPGRRVRQPVDHLRRRPHRDRRGPRGDPHGDGAR